MKYNRSKIFKILLIINIFCNQIQASFVNNIDSIEFDALEVSGANFLVIYYHDTYVDMSKSLFDSDGNWISKCMPPQYIQYLGKFDLEDAKLLLPWLKCKELSCFSLMENRKCNALDIIYKWYCGIKNLGADVSALGIYKIAWLDAQSLIKELYQDERSNIPAEWLETNRLFYLRYNRPNFVVHYKVQKTLELFQQYSAPGKKGQKGETLEKLYHEVNDQLLDLYNDKPKQFWEYLADLNNGYAKTLIDPDKRNKYFEQAKRYRD